jgi:hypothetical protein
VKLILSGGSGPSLLMQRSITGSARQQLKKADLRILQMCK